MIQIALKLWHAHGSHFSVQFLALLNRDFYPAEEPHFETSGPLGTKDFLSPDVTLVYRHLDVRFL